MKKAVGLVIVLLLLQGCSLIRNEVPRQDGQNQNEDKPPIDNVRMRETVFYLPDPDWQFLVPVRLHIPWEEGIARAAAGYLVEGFASSAISDSGLLPLLPAGTEVLGLSIRNGLARIDFSRQFLNYLPQHERLVLKGLVYTLTEFPTITKVEILVEGNKPDLPGGTSITEPLGREYGLNPESSDVLPDFHNTERVHLYFLLPAGQSAYYIPVTRVIGPVQDIVSATVTELLKGPKPGRALFSAIPSGIALDQVSVSGSKATVRLSGSLVAAGGGQVAADRIREQIALTLTDLAGIAEVEILVDGDQPRFPAGVQFPRSFGRPHNFNSLDGSN